MRTSSIFVVVTLLLTLSFQAPAVSLAVMVPPASDKEEAISFSAVAFFSGAATGLIIPAMLSESRPAEVMPMTWFFIKCLFIAETASLGMQSLVNALSLRRALPSIDDVIVSWIGVSATTLTSMILAFRKLDLDRRR